MLADPLPNTSTIRSEDPFITCGVSPKPSAELTMPRTFATRFTRSRLPKGPSHFR
jgi:hypothetical protein